MSARKVIIMSGVPGAGKSTYVRRTFPHEAKVFSDASYFMSSSTYRHDPRTAGHAAAREWCLKSFALFLAEDCYIDPPPAIVIDNPNTTLLEIAPYYALSVAFGFEPEVRTIFVKPAIAAARNHHHATLERVQEMAKELDRRVLPEHWAQNQIPWPEFT